ncbi:excinuclease ABC subunit C [Candidatus Phycorickettsia trachydisci]|uniref:UvrABC system protein C n=1 Tax=Candidatus Phycorickettsia trachydisci TaxID=2115978 RepID=A0A2P1P7T3_9RICK|nr:excinuclease ABC subunit UvrC [Candidatus Phycorickettsia trachydisci]AVP87328.1 excinuclease ABC subunit C [Candidatus Phycorickettsia trachydisci]
MTLQNKIQDIPELPGIYQMLDSKGSILYIGKAKSLKKRVSSYFQSGLTTRIAKMIWQACDIKYIITNSEAEAFLLEASLIKKFKPKFNVLLKDDKSFPYIKISTDHDYPQITKFRGKLSKDGYYFGPFASSGQVSSAIVEIQKIFQIRSCTNTYFKTRKRPCLLYQIKRCSGPCTAKISLHDYQNLVDQTKQFLSGKFKTLIKDLNIEMKKYSEQFEYEKAASIRDRIKTIEYVQSRNIINSQTLGDADIIAVKTLKGAACVQVFIYRCGQNLGNQAYFPKNAEQVEDAEILQSFLGQFYQKRKPPKNIILNKQVPDSGLLEESLFNLHALKTKLFTPKTKEQKLIMNMIEQNLDAALKTKIEKLDDIHERLEMIREIFNLPNLPQRIEVYDNSHIMGKYAIGAMIVAGPNGFEKNDYRKFNIRTTTNVFGGDDYQMLREVLTRRLAKLTDENKPDLMIIDGGKGHLGVVKEVMEFLGVKIKYACMSKGVERNKGNETFHMEDRDPFSLPNDNKAMQYLQLLRDQAHNFAITSHRTKRNKESLK